MAAAAAPPGALAQTATAAVPASDGDAERIVITAARVEQTLPDALPSTRVITREEIERSQATDVPDLLRLATSIDIAQTGPLGSPASVFLRGADSRQVLVLIDGVPFARPDFGSPSWQYLALDEIERIEIVRGNLSAVYGAQAIGGVVQIFTRRDGPPQATLGFGSHGTEFGSASAGTRIGEGATALTLSGSLSGRHTDGYSAGDPKQQPGVNPDDDGGTQKGGSLRVEKGWAEGQTTRLVVNAARTKSDYDGFTPGFDDRITTRTALTGLQSRHALGDDWDLGVDLGQTTERFTDPTGFNTRGENRIRQASAQLGWRAAEGQQWQLGFDSKNERYHADDDPETKRTTDGIRLGWLGSFGSVDAQVGLRTDHSGDFGRADTGLLALGWRFAPNWRLTGEIGNAFSTPSFLDVAFANAAVELKPERSRNAEIGLRWSDAGWLARATAFADRQHDRLSFDPITFETINIARASNRGLELQLEGPAGPGLLGAEATFQDPKDRDTDARLKRRSRTAAVVNYRVEFDGWRAGAWVRYVGSRLDTDPVTFGDATARPRTTLALTLDRALSEAWRVAGRIDNVGNSHAPEVLGYTPPDRTFTIQLTGTWQ